MHPAPVAGTGTCFQRHLSQRHSGKKGFYPPPPKITPENDATLVINAMQYESMLRRVDRYALKFRGTALS